MPARKNPWIVEAGEYEVTVIWVEQERSENGDPVIVLGLAVGRWGRFAKERLVFKESSYPKIAEFLIAMGEEFAHGKPIRPQSYLRRRARAWVEPREHRGRLRNHILRWLPATTETAGGVK